MRPRIRLSPALLLAAFTITASAVPAQQPCRHGLLEYLAEQYCENARWPAPYFCPDRQAVRDTLAIGVQNGWRRQNLLAEHHFQPQTGQLNEAGRTAIRRILDDVPAARRTIYVRKADTPEETAARLEAVQQFAAKLAGQTNVPPILQTRISPAGYPAGWPPVREGAVSRKFQVWVPEKLYLPDPDKSGGSTTTSTQ
ncbi:MAG: hypothetical protein ACUVUC_16600 [Thermoguttaceae bacterium]